MYHSTCQHLHNSHYHHPNHYNHHHQLYSKRILKMTAATRNSSHKLVKTAIQMLRKQTFLISSTSGFRMTKTLLIITIYMVTYRSKTCNIKYCVNRFLPPLQNFVGKKNLNSRRDINGFKNKR